MTSHRITLILAGVLIGAGVGLASHASAGTDDPKPGAGTSQHEKGMKQQERTQQQKDPPQQEARGDAEAPAVLLGVVVAVPLPIADVALPRGADYDAEIDEADALRSTLAAATEAVLSKGDHDDLVGMLVDRDRNRLTDFDDRALTTLEGRIDQINEAWREKYGQEFDIAENAVYRPLAYAEGEITDAQAFIKGWPVKAAASGSASKSRGKTVTDRARTQGNIENGREFAVARFPAEFGLPAVNVSFIDEAFGWKIDLPNEIGGEQLRSNLLTQLTAFGERSSQWPAGVLDAQRMASHYVAMALYGVDARQKISAR